MCISHQYLAALQRSPYVTNSKTVVDSEFRAMDSGFLVSGIWMWIPDSNRW